jgi:hypothetical protein
MIVRIQGEGQWEVSGAQIDELDKIDQRIVDIIGNHDSSHFDALLKEMLDYVRERCRPLATEELRESDIILPSADATMDEVKDLFQQDGLIPN